MNAFKIKLNTYVKIKKYRDGMVSSRREMRTWGGIRGAVHEAPKRADAGSWGCFEFFQQLFRVIPSPVR